MKIKKYIASNVQEGKDRVFRELGEDAIILSTRTINKLDGSGEGVIEIVAAIDENAAPPTVNPPKISAKQSDHLDNSEIGTQSQNFNVDKILNEIQELKSQLFELSEIVRFKNISSLSPVVRRLYRILLDSGITENLALNTIIRLNINDPQINLQEALLSAGKILLEKIQIANGLNKTQSMQTIAFIGSTGSGKTSALVKLAIICKLIFDSNVLIISADNIKIGGSDQLQAYSSIAGIQFRSISSSAEIQSVIQKESGYDFIFIDTAGTGQFNANNIDEINSLLHSVHIDHKFLVLQANLSRSAIITAINMFKKLKPTSIILSKTDETTNYGELVEALNSSAIPISYFSTGQNIPDDIEQAERKKLLELLLPEIQMEKINA